VQSAADILIEGAPSPQRCYQGPGMPQFTLQVDRLIKPDSEERANAASHALGGLLAMVALPALALPDIPGLVVDPRRVAGVLVFIASMVLTYMVSAAYHAAPAGPTRRWLRRCDHASIFIFIAGSFTPFALAAMPQGGAAMLAAVWSAALAGVALKLAGRLHHRGLSTGLYLAYGWLVGGLGLPLLDALPAAGVQLLVAGGLAYTVGSAFFLLDGRVRWGHFVWHLFVITGSTCHVLAVQTLP
jgi:hemolysin III